MRQTSLFPESNCTSTTAVKNQRGLLTWRNPPCSRRFLPGRNICPTAESDSRRTWGTWSASVCPAPSGWTCPGCADYSRHTEGSLWVGVGVGWEGHEVTQQSFKCETNNLMNDFRRADIWGTDVTFKFHPVALIWSTSGNNNGNISSQAIKVTKHLHCCFNEHDSVIFLLNLKAFFTTTLR